MLGRLGYLKTGFGRRIFGEKAGRQTDGGKIGWLENRCKSCHGLQQFRRHSGFMKMKRASVFAHLRNDCRTSDETLTDVEPCLRWALDARCKFLDRFPYDWNLAKNSRWQGQNHNRRLAHGMIQRRGFATKKAPDHGDRMSGRDCLKGVDEKFSSKYDGVYKEKKTSLFRVVVNCRGPQQHFCGGSYDSEIVAAVAYDIMIHCGGVPKQTNFTFAELGVLAKAMFADKRLDRQYLWEWISDGLESPRRMWKPWSTEKAQKFLDDLEAFEPGMVPTRVKFVGVLKTKGVFPREEWVVRAFSRNLSGFDNAHVAAAVYDLIALCMPKKRGVLGKARLLNFSLLERSETIRKAGSLDVRSCFEYLERLGGNDLVPTPFTEEKCSQVFASALDPSLIDPHDQNLYMGYNSYEQQEYIFKYLAGKSYTKDDILALEKGLRSTVDFVKMAEVGQERQRKETTEKTKKENVEETKDTKTKTKKVQETKDTKTKKENVEDTKDTKTKTENVEETKDTKTKTKNVEETKDTKTKKENVEDTKDTKTKKVNVEEREPVISQREANPVIQQNVARSIRPPSETIYCGEIYIGEYSDPTAAMIASDLAHLSFGVPETKLFFRSHRLRKNVMKDLLYENLINLEALRQTIMDELAFSTSIQSDWKPLGKDQIDWLFLLPPEPMIHTGLSYSMPSMKASWGAMQLPSPPFAATATAMQRQQEQQQQQVMQSLTQPIVESEDTKSTSTTGTRDVNAQRIAMIEMKGANNLQHNPATVQFRESAASNLSQSEFKEKPTKPQALQSHEIVQGKVYKPALVSSRMADIEQVTEIEDTVDYTDRLLLIDGPNLAHRFFDLNAKIIEQNDADGQVLDTLAEDFVDCLIYFATTLKVKYFAVAFEGTNSQQIRQAKVQEAKAIASKQREEIRATLKEHRKAVTEALKIHLPVAIHESRDDKEFISAVKDITKKQSESKESKPDNKVIKKLEVMEKKIDELDRSSTVETFPDTKKKKNSRHKEKRNVYRLMGRTMKLLKERNVKVLTYDMTEADDVIATVAKRMTTAGEKVGVHIMSDDKDFLQLLSPQITLYRPVQFMNRPVMNNNRKTRALMLKERVTGIVQLTNFRELINPARTTTLNDFAERFPIKPNQFADLLGLCGDKSDNIPGVGINREEGLTLLMRYATVEDIVTKVETNPQSKLEMKVKRKAESALLGKQLAKLKTDIDLGIENLEEELRWSDSL